MILQVVIFVCLGYVTGNDHISHLGKRKIIDSKMPLGGDMLVHVGTILYLATTSSQRSVYKLSIHSTTDASHDFPNSHRLCCRVFNGQVGAKAKVLY